MSKKFLILLLVLGVGACQMHTVKPISKAPASVASGEEGSEDSEDSETQHRQTFIELAKDPDDFSRHERVKKFFDSQRSFFYIAHELMREFDVRLDELHQKKIKGDEISAADFQAFNEVRFKNLIAMEFYERNLHEMQDLYRYALEAARDNRSIYYTKSRKILKTVEGWFAEGWKAGDRAAIILLAQNFEDVNRETFPNKTPNWVPRYDRYTQLSGESLNQALAQGENYVKTRTRRPIDYFIEKKWNDHLEARSLGRADFFSELYDARSPQALDTLEPDPGPNGHVTGNHFPKGAWAFTFDDGPHPTYTPGMFQNLNSRGLHATFFWLTQNVLRYPDLVKKAGEYGFSRACHSYTHANLPTLKPAALNHEVFEAFDGFAKVVGQPATMYRCPYGACGGNGSTIRTMIANRHALEIFWNVDTLDWQDKNPQSVFERAKKQVDVLGRGIILFHDIHPQSVVASGLLMDYIKTNPQLRIALLKDLIGESRGQPFASP